MWLWILISMNIIIKVHGYADGYFPSFCESMLPKHNKKDGSLFGPQDTEPPFVISFVPNKEGEPLTVKLTSQPPAYFRGFMLEARRRETVDSSGPVGQFILLDRANSQLLQCRDLNGMAVSQTTNVGKTSIQVNWTAPKSDLDVTFRATFVQSSGTFWVAVDKDHPPSTTPAPSTTAPSTTAPTTTAPSTTAPSTTAPSTTAKSTTAPSTTAPSTTAPTTTDPSTTAPTTTAKSTTAPSTTAPSTTAPSTTAKSTTAPSTTAPTTTAPSTTAPSTTAKSTTAPSTTAPSTTAPSTTALSTRDPSTTRNTEPSATSTKKPTTPGLGIVDPSTTKPSPTSTTAPSTTSPPIPSDFQRVVKNGTVLMSFEAVVEAISVFVTMEVSNVFMTTLSGSHYTRLVTKVSKILCSVICAAAEIWALALFCDPLKVTLVALVSVMIVINFIQLVIVSVPMEPSHELKEISNNAVKLCSAIHMSFTIAVVYVAVSEIKLCADETKDTLWKVMKAYTAWIVLFVIWIFIDITLRKRMLARSRKVRAKNGKQGWQQRKKKLGAGEGIVFAVSVIFVVGLLCFSVAVIVLIFSCKDK